MHENTRKKVVIGMSGGVDSTAAVIRLQNLGYDVRILQMFIYGLCSGFSSLYPFFSLYSLTFYLITYKINIFGINQ